MERISELVWLYIKGRPFLKEIIRERIVNYSALARKISIEAFGSKKYEDAVKMALIRISNRIIEKEDELEVKILSVLKGSSISILSKVAVVTSTRSIQGLDYLSAAEGRDFITYIIEESEMSKVKKTRSTIAIEKNLNLISIHSPPSLEEVPGVISHILNSLSSEGINVVEFISCYTDTLLVIKESDTSRAYDLLSALTKSRT